VKWIDYINNLYIKYLLEIIIFLFIIIMKGSACIYLGSQFINKAMIIRLCVNYIVLIHTKYSLANPLNFLLIILPLIVKFKENWQLYSSLDYIWKYEK
jgi:hypothetical protein